MKNFQFNKTNIEYKASPYNKFPIWKYDIALGTVDWLFEQYMYIMLYSGSYIIIRSLQVAIL